MPDKTLRRDALGTHAVSSEAGVYEGRVARVHGPGDPLVYHRKRQDGVVARFEEYRDATELARMAEQLPGKPIIVLHPKNKKNLRRGGQAKIIGRVGQTRIDGMHAVTRLIFDGPDGPAAIRRGIRELSLGYDVDHLDGSGNQRGVDIDHLALVPRARCGSTCDVVRVDCDDDSADEMCGCANADDLGANDRHDIPAAEFADASTRQDPIEPSPVLDGDQHACGGPCNSCATCHGGQENVMPDLTIEKLTEALTEAANQRSRADAAERDRDANKSRADQAEKDRDAARTEAHDAKKSLGAEKARADQAESDAEKAVEKARQDADESFEKRVSARVELVAAATPIIGKDAKGELVDLSKMSDRAIQVAVVSRVDSEDIVDSETDQYVAGMYKSALKRAALAAGSRADARTAIEKPRQDAKPNTQATRESGGKALMSRISAGASKTRK